MRYNKNFKKDYDKIFKEDPIAANMLLLLFDLADRKGNVEIEGTEEESAVVLSELMNARFEDPEAYQL